MYEYAYKNIDDFISSHSSHIFNSFGLALDFLDLIPISWNENDQYKKGKVSMENLQIVNDVAEKEREESS